MKTTYRTIRYSLLILLCGGLLLLKVNSRAQSNQLPAPTSHVSDFAGVLDSRTKERLENLLHNLKEKSKIDIYIATVDTVGQLTIEDFTKELATTWNIIGPRGTRPKSLLLVVSATEKKAFFQPSRTVQRDLPDGVMGGVGQWMKGPLDAGKFPEAIDGGIQFFVNSVAEMKGFSAADLDNSGSRATETNTAQVIPANVTDTEKTRPRMVSEAQKAVTPDVAPAEAQKPATSTIAPAEAQKTVTPDVAPGEVAKTDTPKAEAPKTEPPPKSTRKEPATTRPLTKQQADELDADESEEVELTLTLPLAKRAVALKEFLDTHPNSKSRTRARELLISTHAGLGDQKLKNGDSVGGIEQLLKAIEESDSAITDQLFSGVISQIPMNLYVRGERAAAFKAAQNLETKFGSDPKRLLSVAGFYLGVERGDEAARIGENVVKLVPDLAEAHRVLAVGLHISLRLDEAAAEYKRTLELDRTSKVSRVSLADLYRSSGKVEQALALYDEQLKADPKDRAARAGTVVSLFELGRADEANAALAAAIADEPRNLPLLAGTAYWLAAHGNSEKGFDLARQAVTIEPRYTWAQIALARCLLGLKRPVAAERSMRYARQYGKFPTLDYELANVLAYMGLYEEAAEVLRESFTIADGQIETQLAGRIPARNSSFLDLLAAERKAGIFQSTSADSTANAQMMKGLLSFNRAISQAASENKADEKPALAAADEFVSGDDGMRTFRQVYAASRLVRNGIGLKKTLELVDDARKSVDAALNLPVATIAVQADEFRDLRARAISAGNVPDVADAPPSVLSGIMKGKMEDLTGWALFNQEKYPEAVEHLKHAASVLPDGTPSWRGALWHLGAALEQSGQNQEALDAYIKSYNGGQREAVRRSVIEQLYRKINGSLDGLEGRIGPAVLSAAPRAESPSSPTIDSNKKPEATPEVATTAPAEAVATPVAAPEKTPTPEPTPADTNKPEAARSTSTDASASTTTLPSATPTETPSTSPEAPDASLRAAASRIRTRIRITGRILDANKNGIGNVVVVLISPSGAVIASTTDNEGNYSFNVAPTQKTYRLIPSKDGLTFAPIDKVFSGLMDDQKEIDFVGSITRSP
jgi:tetratricopeptide (TPR) repeat protein